MEGNRGIEEEVGLGISRRREKRNRVVDIEQEAIATGHRRRRTRERERERESSPCCDFNLQRCSSCLPLTRYIYLTNFTASVFYLFTVDAGGNLYSYISHVALSFPLSSKYNPLAF